MKLLSVLLQVRSRGLCCCQQTVFHQRFQQYVSPTTACYSAKNYTDDNVASVINFNKQNNEFYGKLLHKVRKDSEPKRKRGRPRKVPEAVSEKVGAESLEPKKRGRPKKIKEVGEESSVLIDDEDIAVVTKRGRPKKIKEVELDGVAEPMVAKKRGRPKKVQTDIVDNEINSDAIQKKQSKSKKDISPIVKPVEYVLDADDKTTTDNSSPHLSGILSYPLFPPHRKEYFVHPVEEPSIYIPDYSDRAKSVNPYLPSVGAILNATQSKESRLMLQRWKDGLVEELGEEGFQQHQQALFARGHDFHSAVEQYLRGTPMSDIQLSADNEGYWNSAQGVMSDISDVTQVEQSIIHRQLCYKGILDCVVTYRDQLILIEWKTSKKPKADIRYTYDNPLQVAAYAGAYNMMPEQTNMVDKAMIVVCYEDGQPAHTHLMSRSMCVDYWGQWLRRLHMYWMDKIIPI